MQMLCVAYLQTCVIMQSPNLSGVEGIKTLVGVTQEWNIHLWSFISVLASSLGSLEMRGRISLINLINRKVCRVDIGRKSGFEWSTDTAKTLKINTTEEWVSLDFVGRDSSKAILRVANKAA